MTYPNAAGLDKVGTYPARAFAGGGYVGDEVLEYRVWCHPAREAEDLHDGSDYYYDAYATYAEAQRAAVVLTGAKQPLALVLRREYIDEPSASDYRHVKQERVTEWPAEFLSTPRRDDRTIPDFLAPERPAQPIGDPSWRRPDPPRSMPHRVPSGAVGSGLMSQCTISHHVR